MTDWEKKENQLGDVGEGNGIPIRTKYNDMAHEMGWGLGGKGSTSEERRRR